eukprot:TRINITY_DN14362_c0_g2_i1.p1 TRINITY_DN14362_c0_g2~~TRINITY_DN14362_c0_g2_i1.p1  ORF type:complete len:165 (+),score=38.12 TRINITY_DN14362_c0_g2_i1:52-546(+)
MLRRCVARLAAARPPPGMGDETAFVGRKMTAELRENVQDSISTSDFAGMTKAERMEAHRAKQFQRNSAVADEASAKASEKEKMRQRSIQRNRESSGVKVDDDSARAQAFRAKFNDATDSAASTVAANRKFVEKKVRQAENTGRTLGTGLGKFKKKSAAADDDDW